MEGELATKPLVVVIGGPNGAGKSTAAGRLLPEGMIFVNADEIAKGLPGSPEVDRLIARGRSETSPAARHAVYRQIEEIIARDRLLLPLFHEQTYRFARPEVEGLSLTYGVTAVDYASLRVRG